MANLETLFIEIDGNAGKASGGINNLMISLSALGSVVRSQLAPMKEYANAIKDIASATKSIGGNAFKGLSTSKVTTGLAEGVAQASKYVEGMENVASVTQVATENTASATTSVKEYAETTSKASTATKEFAEAQKEIGKSTGQIRTAHRHTSGLFQQISRMAKTMLIRMAIKALIKVAKQGLQNYYQYSKSIVGTFYQSAQKLQSMSVTAGNQLGAMLGSLISSIAPVLNVILTIVNAVAEALTMLFSLLGGSTTYSKAKDGFNSIGKSAGGAGGKIKELLADFDELNVIASESGGGGGGGTSGAFGFDFEEVQLPQWMIEWKPLIEALLAAIGGGLLFNGLHKIWGVLKNIFGLGDGTGAKTIKDILYKITGQGNFPDMSNFIDQLGKIGEKGLLAAGGVTGLKTALENFPVVPDLAAFASEMNSLGTGSLLAAAGVELLVTVLPKLKAVIEAMGSIDLLSDLLKMLPEILTNLFGDKTVKVKTDLSKYEEAKKKIEEWCKADIEKIIGIAFKEPDYSIYKDRINEINRFVQQTSNKIVSIAFKEPDYSIYTSRVGAIDRFVKQQGSKSISIVFKEPDYSNFMSRVGAIDRFVKQVSNKSVGIEFDSKQYATFLYIADSITSWIYAAGTRKIAVQIDLNSTVINTMKLIDAWANDAKTKLILIAINISIETLAFMNAIVAWANQTLTKTIRIVYEEVYPGKTNNISSSLSDNQKSQNAKAQDILKTAMNTVAGMFNEPIRNLASPTDLVYPAPATQRWLELIPYGGGTHGYADGAYGIPKGEVFVAQEAGAELIGSINGKTSVANQGQIIEGIRSGVESANAEQNALLRQQNELLRGILDKEASVRLGASAALGRIVNQSMAMYNTVGG